MWLRADRHAWARLGSLATHLAVPLLVLAAGISSLLATRHDLLLGPGSLVPLARTSDLLLRLDAFAVAVDANGAPSSYEAQIDLIEDGVAFDRQHLRVNRPIVADGYTIYLDSYWGTPGDYGVALTVARDPGYLLFVIAGLLLLSGTIASLWLNPTTVWASEHEKELRVWLNMSRSDKEGRFSLLHRLGLGGAGQPTDERTADGQSAT